MEQPASELTDQLLRWLLDRGWQFGLGSAVLVVFFVVLLAVQGPVSKSPDQEESSPDDSRGS